MLENRTNHDKGLEEDGGHLASHKRKRNCPLYLVLSEVVATVATTFSPYYGGKHI